MSKKNDNVVEDCSKYIMNTYARGEETPVLVSGKGCRVKGSNGNQYLDFTSGIAVQNIGHSNPKYIEKVTAQLEKMVHCSNLFYNANQVALAKKLVQLSGLDGKAFFCNSGAEANEAMIKLARLYGSESGRYEIICMKNSFHGRTMGTLSATGQSKVQKGYDPLLLGFSFAEFNDIASVKEQITDKTVAILLEPVQGEGGVLPATPEFMEGVRALCDEHNLLMLCDEVQCGMGRTGKWFGWQNYSVAPDAFSLAKALAGGIPMGAMIASKKLADVFVPGSHASTFGGGALASAAALAVIEAIEDDKLLDNTNKMSELFMTGLQQFADKYDQVLEIRGCGLLIGMVVEDGFAKKIVDELCFGGLLACVAGPNVVRFLPPLSLTDRDLDEALDMIDEALEIVFEPEEEA